MQPMRNTLLLTLVLIPLRKHQASFALTATPLRSGVTRDEDLPALPNQLSPTTPCVAKATIAKEANENFMLAYWCHKGGIFDERGIVVLRNRKFSEEEGKMFDV